MKKQTAVLLVGCVGLAALATWSRLATAEINNPVDAKKVDEMPARAAIGTGLNYSTGLEAGEGFIPGYIGGGTQPAGCGGVGNPCWGTIDAPDRSLVEGHIETAFPFAGAHHLRISHDPRTRRYNPNFGIGVDARYPRTEDLIVQPIAPSTITVQVGFEYFGERQSFRVQPQSASQGIPAASVLFHYFGGVYVLGACNGPPEWEYVGQRFDGEYQELQIAIDPCSYTVRVSLRYQFTVQERTTCLNANPSVEQLLLYGDNYPGTPMDVDNILIESGIPCDAPGTCCDINSRIGGDPAGCVDNVTADQCYDGDDIFTPLATCDQIVCECMPFCLGRACGDDGCDGSCGSCDDDIVCNGAETCGPSGQCLDGIPLVCSDGNACNGLETCDPIDGCRPGQPLNCDDGQFCNGTEACNPSSGCVAGAAPNCDDGQDCSIDTCNEETDACENDDSGCTIPTVSQWGLVVLTITLLVTAKVRFSQRRVVCENERR